MCGTLIEKKPNDCPQCGSSDVEAHHEGGLLKGPFTIKPRRRCRQCGSVFEPPAGRVLSALVAVFGLGSIASPWPGLVEAIEAGDACKVVTSIIFVIVCMRFGLHVASVGLRSLLRASEKPAEAEP